MTFQDYIISSSTWFRNVKTRQLSLCSEQPEKPALHHFVCRRPSHWGEILRDIKHVKTQLFGKFEMKGMNKVHYFLGIEFIRTSDGILLTKCHYILNLHFKFVMAECKPILTLLDRNLKLHEDPARYVILHCKGKSSTISSIWLSHDPTWDIYSDSWVSSYKLHVTSSYCLKRVLRYVSGTLNHEIL